MATYKISGDHDEVLLNIDYKNNRYSIDAQKISDEKFKKEIQKIARDLLKRKHGVNFAER